MNTTKIEQINYTLDDNVYNMYLEIILLFLLSKGIF
jgi:hypothetical protein